MSADETPIAPCAMARSTSRSILASSAGEGLTSPRPRTYPRTWAAPTNVATSRVHRCCSNRLLYPARLVQSTVRWYLSYQGLSSPIRAAFMGAMEPPSPVTSVVMPCRIFDSTRLSIRSTASDCPSMSMKPGATTMPLASTRRLAEAEDRSPMAAMRSPLTPRSARNQAAPVPSTMRPCSTTRSSSARGGARAAAGAAGTDAPPAGAHAARAERTMAARQARGDRVTMSVSGSLSYGARGVVQKRFRCVCPSRFSRSLSHAAARARRPRPCRRR